MKRKIFFCTFLILSLIIYAQSKVPSPSASVKQQPKQQSITTDSTKTTDDANAKPKHRRLIQKVDTLTLSDYVMSIERITDNLNAIRDSSGLGYEPVHIGRQLDDISDNTDQIRQNLRGRHTTVNMKSIYLYQSFATGLDNDNDHVRARLNALYNRTYHAKLRMKSVLNDSVFRALYTDKKMEDQLDKKLSRLEHKWVLTDSMVKAGIDSLNILKVKASDNSMRLSGMLNMMDKKLDKAKPLLFGPEVSCLWKIEDADTLAKDSIEKSINVVSSERNAIGYYISQTSDNKAFILLLGLLLFVWLYTKRKLLKTVKETNKNFDFMNLHYLNTSPVMSLLVVLLCLMPFFDAYAPTSYISFEYVLLLGAATVVSGKNEDQIFRFYWLALVIFLVADVLTYLLIEPTFIARLWMLAVHIVIIALAYRFYKILGNQRPYYRWVRAAVMIGLLLLVLAVFCNLFGRFSLSGILGLSGIFAITQALILPVFIDTLIEILLVQLQSSRLKKGVNQPFECTNVIKKIKIPLLIISLLLWLIMLTSNLNIFHDVSIGFVDMLTSTRSVGSISFRLLSVLYFFAIIWMAHISERLISFLFGETGIEVEDITTESKGLHSRLLIIRLLVLVGGYIIAIAASGLPLDKLTILLGALGVGIGMGLQNVVNNFVSGIILIFDGSLQIGDEIEVGGQAGKVKEIGLRASTLSTAQGADVIIPNGNILSQNIVNWTYSNDQKRITIAFTLSANELDANLVNEVINKTIKNIPNVIAKRPPVILYTRVTQDGCRLTVRFWSTISKVEQVKSETLVQLNAAFAAKKIGFK